MDYRKLNSVIQKDTYPIPRIDDTLDTLAGSQWFPNTAQYMWMMSMSWTDHSRSTSITCIKCFKD